jgi:membrane-associated phospholipid phosphatase
MPFDHLVWGYSWFVVICIINFGRPFSQYLSTIAFYSTVIVASLLIVRFLTTRKNRTAVFLRLFYPALLMAFFYQETGNLMHLLFPEFLDSHLVMMEKTLLGLNPTLWLDDHLDVFATEILSLGYFSYYFMIPGLSLALFFGKRDAESKRFITATCLTFFVSYLLFFLYPIEGPRWHFAGVYQHAVSGPLIWPLVSYVIGKGAVHGGCMPSSHVGEALVILIFAIRNYGRRAYFLIPLVILLAGGTIYGRFHYVSDVVVGIIIGLAATYGTLKFYPIHERELT